MRTTADTYLSQVNISNTVRSGFRRTQWLLSFMVILGVFWGLKLTGITMAGEAFCGIEEHVHGETCVLQELICEIEETPAHVHSEACQAKVLQCEIPEQEGHTHGETCVNKILTCTLEETEGHIHGEDCFSKTLLCTDPEVPAHAHTEECYTQTISCGLDESETHQHDETCMTSCLNCTLPETEGHAHSESCYQVDLICSQEELAGHTHTDTCFTQEPEYICNQEEVQAHFHTDECYVTQEGAYICGLEESQGHSHTEECYQILDGCPVEEHTHTVNCYSDLSADLESNEDWEASFAGVTGIPGTAEYLILTAQSQLGYAESTRNFLVDENNVRRGITRYGQWYGNPYGDWSTMFTCFCLNYAETPEVPHNAGADALRQEWETEGLYVAAENCIPMAGNVLLLDKNENGLADATAIITAVEEEVIVVIEGDLSEREIAEADRLRSVPSEEILQPEETGGTEEQPSGEEMDIPAEEILSPEPDIHLVAEMTYRLDDPRILGYGLIPLESPIMMMAAAPRAAGEVIAKTISYSSSIFNDSSRQFVVYTQDNRGNYYAFDGNGNAVRIYIDASGNITSDIANPNLLLWTFAYQNSNNYLIQNVSTGRYMHAHSGGVTTSGAYTSALLTSGNGVKIRSNNEYAQLNTSNGTFAMTRTQNSAAVFRFGYTSKVAVWLDGTNGGLMALGDSPNSVYTMSAGTTFTLPEYWQSPSKYNYTLRGWYDVVHSKYYAPGAEVTVTENMVFYADWVADSYNIGQFNSQVADTISTNDFVTVRMFDYGALFNVQSTSAKVSVSGSGHTETWSLLTSGNNPYNGRPTLDYIFRDWDQGNRDITYPANTNAHNTYNANVDVHRNLYTPELGELLFATNNSYDPENGTGVIGKQYLGTADHLFQLMTDPNDPNYGYYYYNSELNAASYNQRDQRFYVYEYLERTTDSAGGNDSGKYSDFLPLNSPYVNTNGRKPANYTYSGNSGEYSGVTHYMYEAKDNNSSPVGTNYLFGMSIDVDFYLPNAPGTGGNKDFYGKDMHFKFSGDDDVWVFVDNKLVLDLGGIHGIESGDINFSSGVVTINGVKVNDLSNTLTSVSPGEHTLTIYYLERGSSQSNCAIYFNLAPRYSFQIQKEDVLTREILNGAQFSVYTDKACSNPAQLWTSKASHDAGDEPTNVFTVRNGIANMWGMSAGQTYYIKETRKPDAEGYDLPEGIIELNFDMQGFITYKVHVIEENGDLTPGFTVHGIKVDEDSQNAYIVATNIQQIPEQEATEVTVSKVWNDNKNHSNDSITVYLTITEPDGTVRRIREVTLSQRINWIYTWENLPKYDVDGNEIIYGVQEATVPGYVSKVEAVGASDSAGGSGSAAAANGFEHGQTYLLSTRHGYLGAGTTKMLLESNQQTAQTSDATQWVAAVNSDGTVTLTSKTGQTLYYENPGFRASSSPGANKNFRFSNNRLYWYKDHGDWQETLYPVDNDSVASNIIYNNMLYTTGDSNQALLITPQKLGGSAPAPSEPVAGTGNYRITNTPAGNAVTSLTVRKVWDTGGRDDPSLYETLTVRMNLLSNGKESGLSGELSLKNGWTYTFSGLPMFDSNGNPVQYSVSEIPISDNWWVQYGQIISSGGSAPTYSTTVTNAYYTGGPELPSTGTAARMLYILCGGSIMLTSLVYGIVSRRKRERRMK